MAAAALAAEQRSGASAIIINASAKLVSYLLLLLRPMLQQVSERANRPHLTASCRNIRSCIQRARAILNDR